MLDNFSEYIQYLLPAVLKRNKSKNQLLIFCRMMGDTFDDIKDAALRLRKESLIAVSYTHLTLPTKLEV